jgi:hypothetical protein
MKLPASLIAIAAMATVTTITACEPVRSTTVARSLEDGARVEKSWVRTWTDHARFECVASSSGACQVVVFVAECPGPACNARVIEEFSLRAGEAADLVRLPPGYRYCLSHQRKPVAPACTNV